MTVHVHVLCYNEAEILPFTIRHYGQFCSRIVVQDLGSTDGTQEIAKKAEAEIVQHDGKGEFNDLQNKAIKNTCWHGTTADWVIVCDCDELLRFTCDMDTTLKAYESQRLAFVKPVGYEMCSDTFPTTSGQIYDEVKMGAKETEWYSKPTMFSPSRVASTDFGAGAHVVHATLHGGRKLIVDNRTPFSSPTVQLLHFHHLGSVERIGAKYEAVIARLSANNRQFKQGVQSDGLGHAKQKRAMILSRLERVVA